MSSFLTSPPYFAFFFFFLTFFFSPCHTILPARQEATSVGHCRMEVQKKYCKVGGPLSLSAHLEVARLLPKEEEEEEGEMVR